VNHQRHDLKGENRPHCCADSHQHGAHGCIEDTEEDGAFDSGDNDDDADVEGSQTVVCRKCEQTVPLWAMEAHTRFHAD
jgi:hypothetical protein